MEFSLSANTLTKYMYVIILALLFAIGMAYGMLGY